MKNWKRLTAITVITVMLVITASPTTANMGGYLSSLMSQIQNLTPKAYQGQERGYYVGGSASVRWNMQDPPLVSFTAPRLKVGCSGIDIVWGGFSYLDFKHLVQKLQVILSAAPAFAFKIALKTLCEACDNVITALENIADIINQLNVDSCQAAKAIGTFIGTEFAKAVGHSQVSGETTSWFTALTQSLVDVTESWKKWIKHYASEYDCYNLRSAEERRECQMKQGKISFLTPLMRQAFLKIDAGAFPFEGLFRAQFGDVYQNKDTGNREGLPKIIQDFGCYDLAEDRGNVIDAMVSGEYKIKTNPSPGQGNCQTVNSPTQGLEKKVEEALTNIVNKIKIGAAPSAEEIKLINASRVPIFRLLSLAVLVDRLGGDADYLLTGGFIEKLKRPIAYDIAYGAASAVSKTVRGLLSASITEKDNELPSHVVAMLTSIRDDISKDIEYSRSKLKEVWTTLYQQLGDLSMRERTMKEFIYQELAKNKLLDSYVFSKGLR